MDQDRLSRTIVETSPYLYVVVGPDLLLTFVNPASLTLLGYRPEDLIGRSAAEIVHPDDLGIVLTAFEQIVDEAPFGDAEGIPMQIRLVHADGSTTHAEVGAQPRFEDPDVDGMIVRARPMRGQHLLDQALQALVASSPLDDVLEFLATSLAQELTLADVAIAYDALGTPDHTLGFAAHVSTGLPPLLAGDAEAMTAAGVDPDHTPWSEALATGELVSRVSLDSLPPALRGAATARGFLSCWAQPVTLPPSTEPTACIVAWRTVSSAPWVSHQVSLGRAAQLTALAFQRRHHETALVHAALHDTLTGAPNRAQFFERLQQFASHTPPSGPVAVLYLDLDAFKPVNDTHGHAAGDELLKVVTARISAAVRPGDLVARLGGDEFAVLCTAVNGPAEATAIAGRLIQAVEQPVDIDGRTIQVGLSVGVAVGGGQHTGEELLEAADAALYEAKAAGKGQWRMADLSR